MQRAAKIRFRLLICVVIYVVLNGFWGCEPGDALSVKASDTDSTKQSTTEQLVYYVGFVDWPSTVAVDGLQKLTVAVLDSSKTTGYKDAVVTVVLSPSGLGEIQNLEKKDKNVFSTASDGSVSFYLATSSAGTGFIEITVKDTAGKFLTSAKRIMSVSAVPVIESQSKLLVLDVHKPVLLADGKDKSVLSVTVKDDFNHPIPDVPVFFNATAGSILKSAVTDSEGVAAGWIKSERRNTDAFITATVNMGSEHISDTRRVAFSGVQIIIKPEFKEIGLKQRDSISIYIMDADSVPLTNDSLIVYTIGDFTLENGKKNEIGGLTDGFGRFQTWVESEIPGSIAVFASALGVTASDTIKVVDNSVANIPAPRFDYSGWPDRLSLDSSVSLELILMDSVTGVGLAGKDIRLQTKTQNAGVFSDTSGKEQTQFETDSKGLVSFRFKPLREGRLVLSFDVVNGRGTSVFTGERAVEAYKVPVMTSKKRLGLRVLQPVINADGQSKADLEVSVKDADNHPLRGVDVTFEASGGTIVESAVTDSEGVAAGWIKSERRNAEVYVSAVVASEDKILRETQKVVFSGIQLSLSPQFPVVPVNIRDSITVALKDGRGEVIANDTVVIRARNGVKFENGSTDSMKVATNASGQFVTWISSGKMGHTSIIAEALGARDSIRIDFSRNSIKFEPAGDVKIAGNGSSRTEIKVEVRNGEDKAISGAQVKWNTSFGTFAAPPIRKTNSAGRDSIIMVSPQGSGVAVVSVEVSDDKGNIIAFGNKYISILSLKPDRLDLSITPDNIRVNVGEATLMAQAFDEHGNIINGLLIGFVMVKSAGGGDETIEDPTSYTKGGKASSVFKAGSVISQYQSVKFTARALRVDGKDTTILISSDTVGLTISGPPAFVSAGNNLKKLINEEDGVYHLPVAAVVTDINGNKVTDGTSVHFSIVPSAYYANFAFAKLWHGPTVEDYAVLMGWNADSDSPTGYRLTRTRYYVPLHWTDYNNNRKLDDGEEANREGRPFRGEDRDGNGYIHLPPEQFYDINGDGVWQSGDSSNPATWSEPANSTGLTTFIDYNGNGVWDKKEPILNDNGDGICQCAGSRDGSGVLYEYNFEGGDLNKAPLPYKKGGGVQPSITTKDGTAKQVLTYPQTDALRIGVRLTAESNGIKDYIDIRLPIDVGALK